MDAERTIPTVVVARRPTPGREAEFEAWLRRLVGVARDAPGHVGSDIQPPNEVHPGEWVILYQFTDAASLEAWLVSPARAELMREAADLVDGPAREQVIALDRSPDPVTGVASFRVTPGHEHRYAEFHDRLVRRLSNFPGYLHSEVFAPVAGVQDDTVVVFSFDSRAHLDAWLGSDERRRMLDEIAPFVEGERTINVVGGFAGWFGDTGAEVRRWKQASVVLLALFPTALVLTLVRRWLLPDVNWVLGVLFGNVLGVIVLSWVLMPFLTRLLSGWLRR
jgi:antibiotic biosynthesis monooxygenase (ABM) superfamily enzyme